MMNKFVSRFKKMTKGARPVTDDVRFHNWMYKDENVLRSSEYRLNVSPVSSFKKMELGSEKDQFERIKIGSLKELKSRKGEQVKKVVFENKSVIKTQPTSQDCGKSNSVKSNSTVDYSRTGRVDSGEWRKMKDKKINEIMLKNEKQRKCGDVLKKRNRKKSTQDGKVNAYTPRTLSRVECRIKAIEDMKRARMRMNKEREVKDAFRTYLDSFAILKCSFDPQQDFRESMIEMILENGIRKREELEELLACYLTLNCDHYHHLIVKVFKEIWLELNQASFDPYL